MSCRLEPRLEGEGLEYLQIPEPTLGRGSHTRQLAPCLEGSGSEIFQVPELLYRAKLAPHFTRYFVLPCPRDYIAGQSLCRGKARNILKSQSLDRGGDLGNFPSPRVYIVAGIPSYFPHISSCFQHKGMEQLGISRNWTEFQKYVPVCELLDHKKNPGS